MKVALTATPYELSLAPVLLHGPIAESFARASAWGYDGLELHLRDPRDVSSKELLGLSERYDIPVTTLGTGMAAGADGLTFTDPDGVVRRRAVERVKEHIKLAAQLNSAVTIGVLNGNVGRDEAEAKRRRDMHRDCLTECCQTAADARVTLLLEPLNRYECDWLNTTVDALALIEQIGAANLKYLADTFHMNIEEADVAASLRSSRGALGYVHLADTNRQGPGRGHLPVREILRALADVNYDGWLSLECLPIPDAATVAGECLQQVRRLLSELERQP